MIVSAPLPVMIAGSVVPNNHSWLSGKIDPDMTYPLWGSPDLNGIHVSVQYGTVYSFLSKPIQNEYVQELFAQFHGLEGELVFMDCDIADRKIKTSEMMKKGHMADIHFHVYDILTAGYSFFSYMDRYKYLKEYVSNCEAQNSKYPIHLVDMNIIKDDTSLIEFQQEQLRLGYKNIYIRNQYAQYQCGIATWLNGGLLKY